MDECRLCHRPAVDHGPGMIRHKFIGVDDPMTVEMASPGDSMMQAVPVDQGPVRSALSGDPVLRLALIRRGLISADDLAKIEEELKGAGIAVAEAVGQPGSR